MSKRFPENGEELSPAELIAAVTKDFQESGLSFNEYFYPGVSEPLEGEWLELSQDLSQDLARMLTPEPAVDGRKALELAERAVVEMDKAYKHGAQLIEFVRQAYERANDARREKHRQDSARGGRAKQRACPAVFAFLRRRIAEAQERGEEPSCTALLNELSTSDRIDTWHREQVGQEVALIWLDPEDSKVKENRFERGKQSLPAEVGRIKVSTFRDYFTDARASLSKNERRKPKTH